MTQPQGAVPWPAARRRLSHIAVLWSFAVAEPIFDVLRRNREFFVANDVTLRDLLGFVAALSLVPPLLLGGAGVLLWTLGGRRVAYPLYLAVIGLLVTALAAQVLAVEADWPPVVHWLAAAAAGGLGVWAYVGQPLTGTFLSLLSPAVLVFPAIFLLHPSMAEFVRPRQAPPGHAAALSGPRPPIVMVIFDQLPLTSLMSADGGLDRDRYPGFAALADSSTWYRNATAVAEQTGWALPPILTGMRPRPSTLPTTADHPNNLFTLLGDQYHFEAEEPITDLCPDALCPPQREPWFGHQLAMLSDAAVIYAHVETPARARTQLPSLTADWKDFLRGQNWQRRWVSNRDDDRTRGPHRFIDGISANDPHPTLYFLHALLPHEPYVYLPSGQRFTDDAAMPGVTDTGRWVDEAWPVVQAYRRHLTQLGLVVSLVGQMLDRLKREGLWDDALVIVTADHGVSFRRGRPFKGIDDETVADIMPVPLFIKRPQQHEGIVSDRDVEAVDLIPTIADLLDTTLPWHADGVSALADDAGDGVKRMQHTAATRVMDIDTARLAALRDESARRKAAMFGGEAPSDLVPALSVHHELIGTPVAALRAVDATDRIVLVDESARYTHVDLRAAMVPALVTGTLRDQRGHLREGALAIALNGVVRATTTTDGFAWGRPGVWTALVPARFFHDGRNQLEVFVVDPSSGQARLGFALGDLPSGVNLLSRGARDHWAVADTGLSAGDAHGVRWSRSDAVIVAPLETITPKPKSLRMGIAVVPAGGGAISVTFNGCSLFQGRLDAAPWFRTFSLGACPASALRAPQARITVSRVPADGGGTPAPGDSPVAGQGLGLSTLNLYDGDWPLSQASSSAARAGVHMKSGAVSRAGTPVTVELENTGQSVWLGADEAGPGSRRVALRLTWRAGRTAVATATLPLSRTFYPGDKADIDVPTSPAQPVPDQGWDLFIEPVDGLGQTIPVEESCVLRVTRDGQR